MQTLKRLWDLADREAPKMDKEPNYVFFDIGLALSRPLESNIGYTSTPINSAVFASTGGDGVHYGLLKIDGEVTEDSPVVMTIPMNFDDPNLIVGSNLLDFLCLGCEIGYFMLEQLSYKKADLEIFEPRKPPKSYWARNDLIDDFWVERYKQEQRQLNLLRAEFDLKPWDKIEKKLDEMQRRYMPLLQLSTQDG